MAKRKRRERKPIPIPWEEIIGFKEYDYETVVVTTEGRKLRFSKDEFYLDRPR
ncbi:hypothetical protein J7M22_07470 [Candidatus Poribacteria bacterium]|nr:hypothetical protein [Candidatus Poribacteria bacterium]